MKKVLWRAVKLDRGYIERRDFPAVRRGYDPDVVDRHLQELATAVEQLRADAEAKATVAGAASSRVQAIVEAAEQSARQIEEQANAEAQRTRADADRAARETREQADQHAAEHVERAQALAESLTRRARELEGQVEEILGELRSAATGVVEGLRGGAESLRSELEQMRRELGPVREARTAGRGIPAPAAAAPRGGARPRRGAAAAGPRPAASGRPAEPGPPDADPAVVQETVQGAGEAAAGAGAPEGARVVALNMALSGTPREETARYLAENFDLADQEELLDEVYARVGT